MDAKEIYDSCTEKEKQWISNGNYKNSPNVIYRKVYSSYNGENVGFIEGVQFINPSIKWQKDLNLKENEILVTAAIKKEYRGQGLNKIMMDNLKDFFKTSKSNIDTIVVIIDNDNNRSKNSVKKLGFENVKNNIDYLDRLKIKIK